MALEFFSSGDEFECSAYIDRESGHIYYIFDDLDEECPEDIHENKRYEQIPHKRDFGLGKLLALKFSEKYLLSEVDHIYEIFNSRGAYSRFKSILEKKNLLESLHEFESEATQSALLQWCNELDISVSI